MLFFLGVIFSAILLLSIIMGLSVKYLITHVKTEREKSQALLSKIFQIEEKLNKLNRLQDDVAVIKMRSK